MFDCAREVIAKWCCPETDVYFILLVKFNFKI